MWIMILIKPKMFYGYINNKGGEKMNFLKGKKTYIGAVIIAVGAVLRYLGYEEIATMIMTGGGALGLIGVRHAMR